MSSPPTHSILSRQSSSGINGIHGTVASPLQISNTGHNSSPNTQFDLNSLDTQSPVSYPKSKINILLCEKIHELGVLEFKKEGFNIIDVC